MISVEKDKSVISDPESLSSLICGNSKLKIKDGILTYDGDKKFKFAVEEMKGGVESHRFFLIKMSERDSDIIDDELVKSFEKTISEIKRILMPFLRDTSSGKAELTILINTVHDYYSQKAYPLIQGVENFMRRFITQFMTLKVGPSWHEGLSVLLTEEDKPIDTGMGEMSLNRLDFIKLSDVLFGRYEKDQANDAKDKIRDAIKLAKKKGKDKIEIDIDTATSVSPLSYWDLYFSKILDMKEKDLEKYWRQLYQLRCAVAHNRNFSSSNYADCVSLCDQINKMLDSAIKKLPDISLDDEEKQDIIKWTSYVSNMSAIQNEVSKINTEPIRKLLSSTALPKQIAFTGAFDMSAYNKLAKLFSEFYRAKPVSCDETKAIEDEKPEKTDNYENKNESDESKKKDDDEGETKK